MARSVHRLECDPLSEQHGGGEMLASPSELMDMVAQVVARFVQRYPAPPRYNRAEWQAECIGEAWRCVADAQRTFDPTRGAWMPYVARAVWQHLLDFRAGEQRWARRACVSLDAPIENPDGGACEREWLDPASVEVEGMVVARVAWEQALAALSAADKQLVVWVWIEGMSQAKAAHQLSVSQSAIAQRLARIRGWLHRQLEANSEGSASICGGYSE